MYRGHFRRWAGISTHQCSWLTTYVTKLFVAISRQLDHVLDKVAPPIPIEKHLNFRFHYSILSQDIGKWSKSHRFVRDHAQFGIKNDTFGFKKSEGFSAFYYGLYKAFAVSQRASLGSILISHVIQKVNFWFSVRKSSVSYFLRQFSSKIMGSKITL